jgi:hypothetical protein
VEERLESIRLRLELVAVAWHSGPLTTDAKTAIRTLVFSDVPWMLSQIERLLLSLSARNGDKN